MIHYFTKFSVFLADVAGAVEEEAPAGGILAMLSTLILPVVLLVAMYFFMIRPESKRKKEAAKMRNELIVGDEVTTVAGIIGRIVNIKDDTITIETGSDKTRLTFVKGAISARAESVSS